MVMVFIALLWILLAGDIEYKYMVDYWAGQEDLIDDMQNGATCGTNY